MPVGDKNNVRTHVLNGENLKNVSKKILVSPNNGWDDHVMRLFEIGKDGYTPKHSHDWFHVNYIVSGKGILHLNGTDYEVSEGSFAYVPAGEEHQFRNIGNETFSFICIVPKEGDKDYLDC